MLGIVLAAAAGIVLLDQLFKLLVVQNMTVGQSVPVLGNLFSITYVQNRGVAFGMFQNHVWLFAVVTAVLIAIFLWLLISKKMTGKLFAASAMLMIGGGIGNLIDRVFRGFVVDYLSVSFFPPVCNLADYCITIGAFLFVLVLLLDNDNKKKADIGAEALDEQLAKDKEAEVTSDKADDDEDTAS